MSASVPDTHGRYGQYGGQFVPETVMPALAELEAAYRDAMADREFLDELDALLRNYVGRPTPIYHARRLSEHLGGAQIYLKREDLCHTGAHKMNNAIGQALLAKRMGKRRIVADTGAGQHGVASATACAMLGLECVVYMGTEDMQRQEPNVFRMRLLGATVHPVEAGSRTLKEAVSAAIRDWVTNVSDTHFLIGSAVGPHPYPLIVRDLQTVIGREARAQMLDTVGRLPDYVVACVGGGSNAIGIFHAFLGDPSVALVGVEAGGEGVASGNHAATLTAGRAGVLHGSMSYLLQTPEGQVLPTHSISAGLDYPGVGPEHSWLKDTERALYLNVTDDQAVAALRALSETEGIIPALEPSHAMAYVIETLAPSLPNTDTILVNLSGRGDKDLGTIMARGA